MESKHKGFTLVELLIVIVVIAILAAITIVSYGKIKDRAYNAATISAANSAVKLISIAYTDHGQIYLNNGVPHGGYALCMGQPSDYPAQGPFAAGQCVKWGEGAYASQELWDVLKQYGSGSLKLNGWFDGDYAQIRGVTYEFARHTGNGTYYGFIVYSLIGDNQDCGVSGAQHVDTIQGWGDGNNETSCWVDMNKMLGEDPIDW